MNSMLRGPEIVTLRRGIAVLVAVIAGSGSLFAQGVFEAQGVRYRTEVVATGLLQPSAMVFLPDGRGLLVERRSG